MSYIKCGDSRELLREIPDGSVDLVVIDPPYMLNNTGGGLYKHEDKQYVQELEHIKDGFSVEVLDELCRVMKKINVYIYGAPKNRYSG